MDTNTVLTVFGVVITNLAVVVTMHLNTLSHLRAISEEMKDFHGRLCAIEERNSTKILK